MAKILVVEDNLLNLKLLKDLLTIKKHDVIVSTDGVNIVNIAAQHKPAVILMDIQLGTLSGIDLIAALKRDVRTKEVPIIAVTAFAMKSDAAKILAAGCDKYLPKPLVIDEFYNILEYYITKKIEE